MEEIQYTDELLKNIRNDLLTIPPDVFISKWIMEKTPNIFCGNWWRDNIKRFGT